MSYEWDVNEEMLFDIIDVYLRNNLNSVPGE